MVNASLIARISGGRTWLVVMLCAMAFWSAPSVAQTLSVSAVVLSTSNCKFRPGTATTLPFGTIDPSGVAAATTTAVVIVRCGGSAGTATFALTADDGLFSPSVNVKRMRHGVTLTQFMPYTVNLPTSATIPKNVITNITITGSVAAVDYQNVLAGSYNDTLTLTLAP